MVIMQVKMVKYRKKNKKFKFFETLCLHWLWGLNDQ